MHVYVPSPMGPCSFVTVMGLIASGNVCTQVHAWTLTRGADVDLGNAVGQGVDSLENVEIDGLSFGNVDARGIMRGGIFNGIFRTGGVEKVERLVQDFGEEVCVTLGGTFTVGRWGFPESSLHISSIISLPPQLLL